MSSVSRRRRAPHGDALGAWTAIPSFGEVDCAPTTMLCCAALSLLAFTPTDPSIGSRRQFLTRLAAAVPAVTAPLAASAVAARTGLSSPFTGEYDDPNHPGCLRSVKVVGAKLDAAGRRGPPLAYVKGEDRLPAGSSKNACPAGVKPTLADVWNLEGKVSVVDGVDTITIDFAPKTEGRVGVLAGKYDDFNGQPGILFPDGNKWLKVANGTPDRRPPNDTLNSGE